MKTSNPIDPRQVMAHRASTQGQNARASSQPISAASPAAVVAAMRGRAAASRGAGPPPAMRSGPDFGVERRSRFVTVEFQPLVTMTITDPTVLSPIIQHESLWIDTRGFSGANLQVRVLAVISALELVIETSESLDYGWGSEESEVFRSSGSTGYVTVPIARDVPRSDPSRRLRRYLRWRLDNVTANCGMCFRIQLQLVP